MKTVKFEGSIILAVFLIGFPATWGEAKGAGARLYELYESTSIPQSYKRILKRIIERREWRQKTLDGFYNNSSPLTTSSVAGFSTKSLIPEEADPTFKLGEVYAFPNPAKRHNPTLHIEVGIADSVEIRIYDIAGDLAHETRLAGMPQIIDDGQGPQYAYEYTWDISGIGSGVYIYAIRARKGKQDIRSVGKCAVIK